MLSNLQSQILNLFRPVKAYWWRERPNFGDALTPYLLERFAGLKVRWDSISHSSVASVGSILEHIPPLWDGYILGSGKLQEFSRLHLHTNTAKVLALRGPLSARGVSGSFALGDPGLLAAELVGYQAKRWDLGVIPHWQDAELVPRFQALIKRPYTVRVIDPGDEPLKVVREIGACRRVVTSSLHGMIVADAFGLPRRVELCPALAQDGGDFKFRDYSASIQAPWVVGRMQTASRYRVEDVIFSLVDAYEELKRGLAQ